MRGRGLGRELARLGIGALILFSAPTRSAAGGFEVALYTGPAFATYKQTIGVNGTSPQFQFTRLTVKGGPTLDASGGLSLGVGATWFLSNSFGLEGRIDAVDIDLQSFGGDYTIDVGSGSSTFSTPITLPPGETALQQVRPLSLNLRLQSQGRVGIGLSTGISYLRNLETAGDATLSVTNRSVTLPVRLTAVTTTDSGLNHIGFNAGLTLRVRLTRGLALLAEGRGFAFKRAELQWKVKETGPLSTVERALVNSLSTQLDLPLFTPGFWSARAGLSYRF